MSDKRANLIINTLAYILLFITVTYLAFGVVCFFKPECKQKYFNKYKYTYCGIFLGLLLTLLLGCSAGNSCIRQGRFALHGTLFELFRTPFVDIRGLLAGGGSVKNFMYPTHNVYGYMLLGGLIGSQIDLKTMGAY